MAWSPGLWVCGHELDSTQGHINVLSASLDKGIALVSSHLSSGTLSQGDTFRQLLDGSFKGPQSLLGVEFQGIGESLFVPSSDKYLVRSPVCQKVDCLCFFISKSNLQGMQSVCGTPDLQKRGEIASTHLNLKKISNKCYVLLPERKESTCEIKDT